MVADTFVKHGEMDAHPKLGKLFNATSTILVCTGKFDNIRDVDSRDISKINNRQP